MYIETQCVDGLINFNSISFQETPTPINEVIEHMKGCGDRQNHALQDAKCCEAGQGRTGHY